MDEPASGFYQNFNDILFHPRLKIQRSRLSCPGISISIFCYHPSWPFHHRYYYIKYANIAKSLYFDDKSIKLK
jgi:hypothetical protein